MTTKTLEKPERQERRQSLLDKTLEAELRMREASEQFVMLGKRQVSGEEISTDEIVRVCTAAGKLPADFQSLVLALENRKRLRAKKEKLSQSAALYEATRAKLEEANKVLEAAVAEHQRITSPLQEQLNRLRQDLNEYQTIDSDLIATCPCPILKAKHRSMRISGSPDGHDVLREMIDF